MASKELKFLEKIDGNFLVCGICSERYKNAKNLPCLHSFCEECLEQLVKKTGKLECPICRRLHEVPTRGVSGIPSNFFVNELVDEFGKRDESSAGVGKCEGCEEAESVKHCVECDIDFCRICASSHSRVRVTRSHQLLTIAEYQTAKFANPTSVQAATYCTSHEDYQIEFYCNTCDTAICLKCTALSHRSHEYRCVEDAARDYCKELAKMIENVKVKEDKASVIKKGVKSTTESLDDTSKRVEAKVKTHAQKTRPALLRMVQNDCDKLLTELKDEYDTRSMNLNSQLKELELMENDFSNAREFAENLMHYGNAAQVMTARKRVSAQLEELLKVETKVEPVETDHLDFDACTDFCAEKRLGVIQKGPGRYRVTQTPKLVRVGDDITVTMASKSIQRISLNTSQVGATMKTSEDKTEKVEVSDKRDGTVTLKSHARTKGKHELPVSVRKKTVEGSPVRSKVIPKKGLVCKFGGKGDGVGRFNNPWGVTMTRTGGVLVCDFYNHRLQSFTLGWKHKNLFKFTNQPNAVNPYDAAVSVDGEVFITDNGNKQVIVCNENGQIIRCFGKGKLKFPIGVAIHPLSGKVYVMDFYGHCVHIYNQDGSYVKSFGSQGSGDGQFNCPEYVAIDHAGKVYVSDSDNHRIQVFDGDGQFLYCFGSKGSGDGQLNCPYGVAVDKHRNVYVADTGNRRIVKFKLGGRFVCRIDSEQDWLSRPRGICVTDDEPLCQVIVADNGNHRVSVFAQ